MLKITDTVKVISKTNCGGIMKELIPVGTICIIVSEHKDKDGSIYYGVTPLHNRNDLFYYLESELEKGSLQWVKEKIMNKSIKEKIMNKSSKEFDQELLNSLIGKKIPISSFEDELQKIFKRKSSHKLWWDNEPTKIWDGKEYHNVNFRCCPESSNTRYMFCMVLEHQDGYVEITEGYLEAL